MSGSVCEARTYSDKIDTHSHGFGQLILPIEGHLSIKTELNEIKLDENHVFFLPKGRSHSFHSKSTNEFMVVDFASEIHRRTMTQGFSDEFYMAIDERWRALRYLLREELGRQNGIAMHNLIDYASNFVREGVDPASIRHIHENLDMPITIKELAAIENFNESYYIEWFSRKMGLTPNAYIQRMRIDKAKEYLRSTDYGMLEVSGLVGYENQSSLTRLFKTHLGMTPSAYRKKFRK